MKRYYSLLRRHNVTSRIALTISVFGETLGEGGTVSIPVFDWKSDRSVAWALNFNGLDVTLSGVNSPYYEGVFVNVEVIGVDRSGKSYLVLIVPLAMTGFHVGVMSYSGNSEEPVTIRLLGSNEAYASGADGVPTGARDQAVRLSAFKKIREMDIRLVTGIHTLFS